MSRVIKFRAWDVRNSQMVYEPFLFQKRPDYLDNPEPFVYYGDDRDYEDGIARLCYVMQFTGLHDKNGKEIYEGDVVRFYIDDEAMQYTYTVEWDDFSYKLIHATPHLDRLCWGGINRISEIGWEVEVIGNIYENPELLQEKGGEG